MNNNHYSSLIIIIIVVIIIIVTIIIINIIIVSGNGIKASKKQLFKIRSSSEYCNSSTSEKDAQI